MTPFANRKEAGQKLASCLLTYHNMPNTIVIALPRGGVPVGYEIAKRLNLPLDILIVRKLGVPGYEELAIGALASGGFCLINQEILRTLPIALKEIESVIIKEKKELKRREELYRGNKPFPELTEQVVILVDDGLATGASMKVAVRAIRQKKPKTIIVAAPVCAAESCKKLEAEADQVICFLTPPYFTSVGNWYKDFSQLTDEEVRQLLNT